MVEIDEKRLAEIEVSLGAEMPGHSEKYVGSRDGVRIGLTCITPDAHTLLDEAMRQWKEHSPRIEGMRDPVYSFAYWLVRYSGLVFPEARQQALDLLAEVRRLQAELVAERERSEQLRQLGIDGWPDGFQCAMCGKDWETGEDEEHNPGCIVAPPTRALVPKGASDG